MTSSQFQELMRHLGCINGDKFEAIFGSEMGQYLAEKFFIEYKRNVRNFICYLDSSNMELLWKYLKDYLERIER